MLYVFVFFPQRNHSELCVECRTLYKALSYLYSNMSKTKKLCIDVEDAVSGDLKYFLCSEIAALFTVYPFALASI